MDMKKYKLLNNTIGWITFIIASVVYLLTIEPTTSFWDCGEFIATSYKLEVGHPPGAPLYMIMARFFSLFAGRDVTKVAIMINAMSALASSFTILFLFWTITHLAKKILIKNNDFTTGKVFAILGSGLVGALAYTFSDTFWFSAVEGEVYATSSLFTAVVFWAILKWENVANEKYANRWIILIAYLMGLSMGVHLLNLLAIPAIVFVYYFKKYEVSKKGIISAVILSIVILGVMMYGIVPGVAKVASWFELLIVNGFHLPYNTGIIIYALLLIFAVAWGLNYTIKNKKVVVNTIILTFMVIVIGYSSYSMIVIRSLADPPMDENNPETVFALMSYLSREQYGDHPLSHGQYYNAPLINRKDGKPTYTRKEGRYKVTNYTDKYVYDPRFTTIFPRMYSPKANHIQSYKVWGKIKGTPVRITNNNGEQEIVIKPTFGENLKFFFRYQLGHMYFRYFMWNFAGRQNDIQSHGSILKGNWLSGIKFIDEARLGPQDKLPMSIKSNKAMNKYYMLPLLLGLIGLLFHFQKKPKDFWVVLLLFVLTGIAVVVYLNQHPNQPRERDYAYAGSFYAFAIWIGLGVLAIYDLLKRKIPAAFGAILATVICLVFVPGIMAKENWNDHDRSGRYTARDFAFNYLNSCAPNAILFTNGDNDTFPLWYAQEVEGIRTDVRVVNLMLLNTDWYIDQMKRKAYESESVPFSLTKAQYIQGTRDVIMVREWFKNQIELKQIIEFVADDNPKTKTPSPFKRGDLINVIPSKNLRIPVDSAKIIANGTVRPELADKILPYIDITLNKNYLNKSELMVIDLLATNNWDRPVYYVSGGHEGTLRLEDYFQLEGFAYRLVPIKTSGGGYIDFGRVEPEIMYDNIMNKFKWGRIDKPDVFIDYNNIRTISVIKLRSNFTRLANELLLIGKRDSAVNVLDKCMELFPHEKIPYDIFILGLVEIYYKAGEFDKANEIANKFAEISKDDLEYYLSLKGKFVSSVDYEKKLSLHIFQELVRITKEFDQKELGSELEKAFNNLYLKYINPSQ